MTLSAVTRVRIEKDVVTRVTRALGGKGQLNVRVGQQVEPAEIIGTATISAGFRTLNLATLLSVAPQSVEKYLTRKLGQKIYKGELLAYKKSWLPGGQKVVTAPTDGVLDFLNPKTGELKIIFLPKKLDLPAGVYGIVESIDAQRGQVVIRAQVSRIFGILGSGRLREGILHILGAKNSLITSNQIQVPYDRHILVGGSLFFKDAISAAISAGVGGLIAGGINAADYKAIAGGHLVFPRKIDNDIGISVVICEGFGSIPLGGDIFNLLCQHEGKFIFIDGNRALISLPSFSSASLLKVKSTRLPSLLKAEVVAGQFIRTEAELKTGMKVRVAGNSYAGAQGVVRTIDNSPTLLGSGIKDCLVTVETEAKKIQVPVANLEIIV